jgi:hypothetical protein
MVGDRIIAEVHDYGSLIAGLRKRIEELGTRYEALDELMMLPVRYTSKVLGPRPSRLLSARLFQDILSAAAVKVLLVEDEKQLARIKDRLDLRSNWGESLSDAIVMTYSRKHFRDIGRKGGVSKRRGKRHMRRIAKMGGLARMKAMTAEQRKALSRKANNILWGPSRNDTTAG